MKAIILIACLISAHAILYAGNGTIEASTVQEREITGTVIDENGEALVGANILIEGSRQGTITDVNGKYTIVVPDESAVLIISFVGYRQEEVLVGNKTMIDIQLFPEYTSLEKVVVIGYGTAKKSDLTGSVSKVNVKDMNTGPLANITSQMLGTSSGVLLQQSSSQPGGAYILRIRGETSDQAENQPLIVIDGFPVEFGGATPGMEAVSEERSALNSINPADIESIEILKDASATAIYGSRGANGVIIVTTKQGQQGKMKVSYNGSQSFTYVDKLHNYVNAQEYIGLVNRYANYRPDLGRSTRNRILFSPEDSTNYINQVGIDGTDWQRVVLRDYGQISSHQISASGGADNMTFYTSLGYYGNEGIVENTGLERYSIKSNIVANPSDKLEIGVKITGSLINDDQIEFGDYEEFGYNGVFSAHLWAPIYPVYDTSGNYYKHDAFGLGNPVAKLEIEDKTQTDRVLIFSWAEYKILDNLKVRLQGGFDREEADRTRFEPNVVAVNGDRAFDNEVQKGNVKRFSKVADALLNYETLFGDNSNFNILLGGSYQHFDTQILEMRGINYKNEAIATYAFSSGTINSPPFTGKEEHVLVSSFIRSNLILADKYLFTFTARADGSSRFGASNKWGYFPSGAFAWKLHNEPFLESFSEISELKLRSSYGVVGNQEISNYRSLATTGTAALHPLGGVGRTYVRPEYPANPNIQWESTHQFEIGIDYALFKNRIAGLVNFYSMYTDKLLASRELELTYGYGEATTNMGATQNNGVEFELHTYNISGGFNWETSFNFSYNKNKWKDRGGLPHPGQEENALKGAIYGYDVVRVFSDEEQIANSEMADYALVGQWQFRDLNSPDNTDPSGVAWGVKDGVITTEDRILLGSSIPEMTFGINNIFRYRYFTLSFFWQGVFGAERLGIYANRGLNVLTNANDRPSIHQEYNELIDTNGEFDYNNSRQLSNGIPYTRISEYEINSITVEDASFIRLRNVTLSYSLGEKLRGRVFKNATIHVDGHNLLTFTKFSGLDPETGDAYPRTRMLTLGINLDF